MMPKLPEQEKLGAFFEGVDILITLHQCKYSRHIRSTHDTKNSDNSDHNAVAWEQRKLNDFLEEKNRRTSDFVKYPIFSLTIEDGITPKTERYERNFLVRKKEDLFKIVAPGDFVTNPMNLRFGAFGYNQNTFSVSVSGYYDVFEIDSNQCNSFWYSYFKTPSTIKYFDDSATGSLVEKRRVKYSTLKNLTFLVPKTIDERKRIGMLFSQIDDLITLHQCKYSQHIRRYHDTKKTVNSEHNAAAWEQRKLGDISDSFSGGTPTAGKSEYYGGDIPFIRSAEVNSDTTELFLTEEGLKNSSAKMVKKGDILYALYGATSGETGLARLDGAINQAILDIKPHANFDAQFIMQWLRRSKERIIGTYLQGGQGNLSGTIVTSLIIECPTYDEQRRIGEILKELDDLITLHQRDYLLRFYNHI